MLQNKWIPKNEKDGKNMWNKEFERVPREIEKLTKFGERVKDGCLRVGIMSLLDFVDTLVVIMWISIVVLFVLTEFW